MSESKTFILPDGGQSGSMMPLLASLCQKQGVDPNVLLAMRGGNGWGGNGIDIIVLLFLFMLFDNNGFGFGNKNGNLPNMINNDAGRELLMNAIQGNGNAIGQLATTLNCDFNQVNSALQALATQLQGVGNQVGMSGMQVINAIQSGNAQLASQLAQCCCDNKMAICQQTNTLQSTINGVGNAMERGFSDNAFRMRHHRHRSLESMAGRLLRGQRFRRPSPPYTPCSPYSVPCLSPYCYQIFTPQGLSSSCQTNISKISSTL